VAEGARSIASPILEPKERHAEPVLLFRQRPVGQERPPDLGIVGRDAGSDLEAILAGLRAHRRPPGIDVLDPTQDRAALEEFLVVAQRAGQPIELILVFPEHGWRLKPIRLRLAAVPGSHGLAGTAIGTGDYPRNASEIRRAASL
jgi:hypothetical protein